MATASRSKSAQIRARLNHPIIDSDGHTVEVGPLFFDYLKTVAGAGVAARYQNAMLDTFGDPLWRTRSLEERREIRTLRPTWWAVPAKNTADLATALFPRLMYERLEEMGLDFSVVYPTIGLITMEMPDDEMRRASCRALNRMKADTFSGLEKRMTPAAVIPMHTPAEAIEELEYCVRELGLKAVMMASYVKRPIPFVAKHHPAAAKYTYWMDTFGIDSAHDYDPVWAKCVELGVSPTFHSGSRGIGLRVSPTNFVYNHIGHFAAASEAVCKAIFMGGVTQRFPSLKMGFLEGGVGWACALYSDLIGHWKKRNREALEEVNPANLDTAKLAKLVGQYGGKWIEQWRGNLESIVQPDLTPNIGGIKELDDYAACKIKRPEDIRDLFVNNFYFGCEADDALNVYAFNRKANPYGAKMNVLFGSDIGHFDVQDMKEVVPEAYELVEEQLITDDDFRDFMFTNPVRFWGEANPDFFKGTRVEKEARAVLDSVSAAAGR